MNYTLVNAEEQYPVQIPSEEDRFSLDVGDLAKVIFVGKSGNRSERMWVEVTGYDDPSDPSGYVGKLVNIPIGNVGAKYGSTVRFFGENVIAVQHGEDVVYGTEEVVVNVCKNCI